VEIGALESKVESKEGLSDQSAVRPRLEQGFTELAAAVRNATFYGLRHSVTKQRLGQAATSLAAVVADGDRHTIHVAPDHLVFDRFPLCPGSAACSVLAEEMRSRDIGTITLVADLSHEELEAFVEVLITDPQALQLWGGAQGALARQEVSHILLEGPQPEDRPEHHREALTIYQDAIDTVKRAMSAVEKGGEIDGVAVRTVVEEMLASVLYDRSALLSLAAIKSWDEYLYEHCVNVCIVGLVFGCTLGLNEGQMVDLGMSAILHDIGKVFVPLEIVRKPGPLTEDEWAIMQTHPVVGARMLGTTRGMPDVAAVVAFEHHLRYDHSGYPRLQAREAQHLYSHLLTIVDCYDSLTTVRPYRAPIKPDQAAGWMLYVGKDQFEPRLLARFAGMLRVYPVGAVVKLNTNDWGIIVSGSERDLARPKVRLIVDANGETISRARVADLSERDVHGGYLHSITECLQPVHQISTIASVLAR
jgi:HD-GYP domain-containing protein (c-di-GMP phosphodiesterase class II)